MGKISPETLRFYIKMHGLNQTKLANLLKISGPSVNRYFQDGVTIEKFEQIGRLIGMPDNEIAEVISEGIKKHVSVFHTFENQGTTTQQENQISNIVNDPADNYAKQKIGESQESDTKQLMDLANLFRQGFLTAEEFSEAKKRVLKI